MPAERNGSDQQQQETTGDEPRHTEHGNPSSVNQCTSPSTPFLEARKP